MPGEVVQDFTNRNTANLNRSKYSPSDKYNTTMHNQEYFDQQPRPYKSLNNINNNNNNIALSTFNHLETASTCSVGSIDAYAANFNNLKSKRSPYAFSDFRCDYSDIEVDSGPPRPPDPEIYSPPIRHKGHVTDSMATRPYRGRLDRSGGHRRTWSPPAFSQALSLASQLKAQRIYRSNDQLDNEAIYEELPDGPAPPRLPLVSGQLQDGERPMIKPVAYKPMIKSNFHLMGSQQRLTPSHTSPAMVSPTHSHSSTKSITSPKSAVAHSKPLQQPLAAPKPPTYRVTSQNSAPKNGLPSPTASGLSPTRLTEVRMNSQDEGYVSQECSFPNYSMSSSNMSPPSLPQSSVASTTHGATLHQQHPLMSRSGAAQTPESKSNSYGYHNEQLQLASYPQLEQSARSSSYADLTETVSVRKDSREERKGAERSAGAFVGLATPSPSDSGVGEVELMLRDKDAEIAALRETMAANENAMMKVHEEKRQNWEMEMREMSSQWETRLRTQQQKTFRMEQALLLQLFKLQQERKTLRLDCEQLRTENELADDKVDKLTQDLSDSQTALEELRWDMCQKTGEISMLKKNVKQSNEETTNRSQEVFNVRSQAKELQNVIQDKNQEIDNLQGDLQLAKSELEVLKAEVELLKSKSKPPSSDFSSQADISPDLSQSYTGAMPSDVHTLQQELLKLRTILRGLDQKHEADKRQWLDEKNKVIRYQKHLQLNYVQMYKKNRTLECEIEQLMVELENRDLKLTEVNPHGPNSPQESMC